MIADADDARTIAILAERLAAGGVAIAPCDTMYGLIGIAPESGPKLRGIKGRSEDKPFVLLLASVSWIERVSDASVPERLARHWPGPLTLVVPSRGGGTVAVRVPDSAFLRKLMESIDRPIYSTSVNRAGHPPMNEIARIRGEFESEVDLIVDAGDMPVRPPSTIVDVTSRPCRVVRSGAIAISREDLSSDPTAGYCL